MSSPQYQEQHWVVLGDIHERVEDAVYIAEIATAEGILVTGDLTNTGGVLQAERVMRFLRNLNPRVFAQFGNMDRPEVDAWLTEEHCNLHRTIWELLPDTALFGIGASIFTPFGTPSEYPESDFTFWLETCWEKVQQYRHVILVAHNPPYDTNCDCLANGTHVGSTAVKEFIEEYQPDICICGHIHESRALDRLGRTFLVNPGSFVYGQYCLLKVGSDGKFSVELCSVQK